VAFDASSRFLVTGARDGKARFWNLQGQNPAVSSTIVADHGDTAGSGITAVALSDDAQWLVTGDYDGLVRVWNLAKGEEPLNLRGHKSSLVGAAFSSDGNFVITGSEDATIRIWNLKSEQPESVPVILREDGALRFLSMSKDGRWIVSGDYHATHLWQLWLDDFLWQLWLDDLISVARTTAGRNLSQAEWSQYFAGQPYHKTFEDLPAPGNWRTK
jgi:WD40 repeat protein